MRMSDNIIKYRKMVDYNEHGVVLEAIAIDYKLSKYAKIFQSINIIHNLEGSLSTDLLNLRNKYKAELFSCLENILSEIDLENLKRII